MSKEDVHEPIKMEDFLQVRVLHTLRVVHACCVHLAELG